MGKSHIATVLVPSEAGAGSRPLDHKLFNEQEWLGPEECGGKVPNSFPKRERRQRWEVFVAEPKESAVLTSANRRTNAAKLGSAKSMK